MVGWIPGHFFMFRLYLSATLVSLVSAVVCWRPAFACWGKLSFSLCVLPAFQHVFAVVVEVNEGALSVLLPCQYTGVMPEDPMLMWTRNDIDPKFVHVQEEEGPNLEERNQRYSGRTSVRPDGLEMKDFSLTLTKPKLTDSGNYTCSIRNEWAELKLTDVHLHVKGKKHKQTKRKMSN